jgi:hypothetical protein
MRDTYINLELEKNGFNLGIDLKQILNTALGLSAASSVSGAVGGASRRKAEENFIAKQNILARDKYNQKMNYYGQVENIVKNIVVIFTPVSVVYRLSGIVVDIIELEDMNEEIKHAWKSRDELFFKNLLFNKISTEIQLGQQFIAQQLLDKSINMNNQILNKQGELDEDVEKKSSSFTTSEGFNSALFTYELMSKLAQQSLAYKDALLSDIDLNIKVPMSFGDWKKSFKDSEDFTYEKNAFFNIFTENSSNIEKYKDPAYINKNLRIMFMPDRVLYLVGKTTISQLPMSHMSGDAIFKFHKKDHDYFKHVFFNIANEAENAIEEKTAQESVKKNFFNDVMTPANVLYKALIEKFKKEWLSWEPEILIKAIEGAFDVDDIPEIIIDKLMMVKMANTNNAIFVEPYLYEKCVRVFNNKPIEFGEIEEVTIGDIINCNRILDIVTPVDDIFDNFENSVIDYIVSISVVHNYRAVSGPRFFGQASLEDVFYEVLNKKLVNMWNEKLTDGMNDTEKAKLIFQENIIIQNITLMILALCREGSFDIESDLDTLLNSVLRKYYNISNDEYMQDVIRSNILRNLTVDMYIKKVITQETEYLQKK